MGLSSAVDWWEEWQLRILVLGSQCVQWLLFFSASRRKSIVSASLRLLIWLAYLGSDAVAIYALAALFNRHRKELRNSHGESVLEVVWAPVLLMHLGGQDCITAYNMEDNELWKRHALISLAQVTVSIYVFCKSWRGGDKKLLQAAIMLFTLGGIRCLEKPFALKKASINSLVSSSDTTAKLPNKGKNCEINLLEEYVKKAMALYRADHLTRAQGEGNPKANHHYDQARGEDDIEANRFPDQSHGEDGDGEANSPSDQAQKKGDSTVDASEADSDRLELGTDQVNKLFVDLASPYCDRLSVTKAFLKLDEEEAYKQLQERLSDTFDLLYTKAKMVLSDINKEDSFFWGLAGWFRFACVILPFTAIGLFHRSHREAYNDKDVKVTYTLLCCTAVMELFSYKQDLGSKLSGMVPQYSFMGYFVRNKKYTKRMSILSCLRCKEYVNQQWSMKPSNSSFRITILVRQQVIGWWKRYIEDAAAYMRFNNHRGQWTIWQARCGQLGWSIKRSFDESVLLWHIATDICFYKIGVRYRHRETAEGCRDISNYMMYLLYTKPEMLMAGTRRNLLIAAYRQLDIMLESQGQQPVDERAVAHKLIAVVEESPEGGLIHDAWGLAKLLLDLNDDKMWKVIEGVWVEMVCYSASRCQGYLHAKSLGTGGELLTFVWLLWSHMGMETLAERMQMSEAELPSEEENKAPWEEEYRAPREEGNDGTGRSIDGRLDGMMEEIILELIDSVGYM